MEAIRKFIDSLTEEKEKELAWKIFNKGKDTRVAEQNFRDNAQKIFTEMKEKFEAKIQSLRSQAKELLEKAALDVDFAAENYVSLALEIKAATLEAKKSLDDFQANPPGMEERQNKIKQFNETVGDLSKLLAPKNIRIAWQLTQCATFDPEAPDSKVPFEVNFRLCSYF